MSGRPRASSPHPCKGAILLRGNAGATYTAGAHLPAIAHEPRQRNGEFPGCHRRVEPTAQELVSQVECPARGRSHLQLVTPVAGRFALTNCVTPSALCVPRVETMQGPDGVSDRSALLSTVSMRDNSIRRPLRCGPFPCRLPREVRSAGPAHQLPLLSRFHQLRDQPRSPERTVLVCRGDKLPSRQDNVGAHSVE